MAEVFMRLFDRVSKKHLDNFLNEVIPKISPEEE